MIDFGVNFWFRCPTHGRFSLQDVYREVSYEELLNIARDIKEVICPKCGEKCSPCPCKGGTPPPDAKPVSIPDQVDVPQYKVGCVKCVIGAVCKYCGRDLRL